MVKLIQLVTKVEMGLVLLGAGAILLAVFNEDVK